MENSYAKLDALNEKIVIIATTNPNTKPIIAAINVNTKVCKNPCNK